MDIDETNFCYVCVSDICELSFCVAVVEWMDLLALGRLQWPHGHHLAAIGKGSGYRSEEQCRQPSLTVNHYWQIMKYRYAAIVETIVCNVCMSDICALSFCVAVVEWTDLLALGRLQWPHGHHLAAIGKGSGYRSEEQCEQPNVIVNNH
jgi:hypothetical protein